MNETCSVCRGMGVCPRCGGYGRDDDGDRCPVCGGDGQCPAPSCHEGTVYYDELVLQTCR